MRKKLLLLWMLLPMAAMSQTFDFDMTKPQPVFNDAQGYGYDLLPAPDNKKPNEPFYFSVRVDDGNYRHAWQLPVTVFRF